jgi:pyridoxal phosphate enzyme (YggS family)
MNPSNAVRQNYERVLENITLAAQRVQRDPASIRLVVVTKTHPAEAVYQVIEAGARTLGENYAEEAVMKMGLIGNVPGLEWHMIGHVQSRKAGLVTQHFGLIHSLDSIKLAGRLNRTAGEQGRRARVLIQVNVSGEESKYGYTAWNDGFFPALFLDIEPILAFENIEICGLMTMPPYSDDPEQSRPHFRRLFRLRNALAHRFPTVDWRELSMGMSGDYAVAVEEGATLVRVGTAIMGERDYSLSDDPLKNVG